MRTRQAQTALALALGLSPPTTAATLEQLRARGDSAWERRAEGHVGTRARPGPIREAVAAYSAALEADPGDLETRVDLLRSLAFFGEYATTDRSERVKIFARGRRVAEEGIDRLTAGFDGDARPRWQDEAAIADLSRHLEDRPLAVGVYLIGAYHWGLWGRYRGIFAAVRQGVAGRLRDYGAIAIALDPLFANAGPHRLVGRLHHEAPRVPFFTPWIDRRVALAELQLAVELGPDDYLGRLFWVEVLLEHDRSRRDEALRRLVELCRLQPRPQVLIEDLDALGKARALLSDLGGSEAASGALP